MDEILIANAVKKVLNEITSKQNGKVCEKKLTLELSKRIIEKVKEKAESIGLSAVIAVVDKGGNPIAVECMDDAYIASYDIALNKAFTSVSLKMPTSALASLCLPGGSLYGLQYTNNGRIVIFGGGETLEINGQIVGGIGVSGGTLEQDKMLGEYAKKTFLEVL